MNLQIFEGSQVSLAYLKTLLRRQAKESEGGETVSVLS